ncbi:MAG TPA: low affinity iron permease family protein [Xanthomonadales bacterium]|nr:low affinity iron permease family protein [Xanthomonadales bacterium]
MSTIVPKYAPRRGLAALFDRFAGLATHTAGHPLAFVLALAIVVAWAVTGPLFGFSEVWQLVINTATTIVTFLMVFVIQHAQNKDSVAIHLKLNELIASQRTASNRLVSVEDLDDRELDALRAFYCRIAELAKEGQGLYESHSLDEAVENHSKKGKARS